MTIELRYVDLPNLPIVFGDLPEDIKQNLIERVKYKSGKSHSKYLAGHLKTQLRIDEEEEIFNKIDLFFREISKVYIKEYFDVNTQDLLLADLWINYQNKYEFNPPHEHEGIVSFVIWFDIPYNLEEELALFDEHQSPRTSVFNFLYTNILGHMSTFSVNLDKTNPTKDKVGFCLFPSQLKHYVNPFYTSDKQRITLSGNIREV